MEQRQGTLQFWDEYHADNEQQEWISTPSKSVLQMIYDHSEFAIDKEDPCNRSLHVMEIGCGTSSLIRDFKLFIENQNSSVCVHACGTDVSPVCIESLQKRDKAILQLSYKTLNVAGGNSLQQSHVCDLILDKGCLYTFLFRTRCRGKGADYNELVGRVLDNIHTWLKPTGKYMLITPRAKLKAVRDYTGFASMERFALPAHSAGALEGSMAQESKARNKHLGYLHVCTRNNDYVVGSCPQFRGIIQRAPPDDAVCRACGITFLQLRNGESLGGQGGKVWARQWKGHCTHCKGKG
jgi:hypothetical protein